MKALHAKIMEDVCLCTRKTVMCASAVMGSLEFTVRKVRHDKTHPLSSRSTLIVIVKYRAAQMTVLSVSIQSSPVYRQTY